MAEYISREAVLKAFKLVAKNPNKDYQRGMQDTIDCLVPEVIADIPSADVQPVKHGYWEEVTDYGGWGDTNYRCSVCGEEWYLEDGKPKDNNMNFCPRCGAKMNLNSVANDKTRNLTDEETDIYNDQLEAEAETIEKVSLLSEKVEYKDPCKCCHNGKCEQCYYGYCSEEDKKKKWLENHKRK